ncbi:MAG: Uma2 family endonuclease [Byssovorax sp.]
MSSAGPKPPTATLADLLAIPENARFHEILDGELIRRAMPSLRHGTAQMGVADEVAGPYGPRSHGRGPGGWIFASEVEIQLEPSQIFRPDVSGWHRERLSTSSGEVPIQVRPDWVCEILSPSNARNDLIKKMRVYQRCHVQHYWILDPEAETLSAHRWTAEGYLTVQTAEGQERISPSRSPRSSCRCMVSCKRTKPGSFSTLWRLPRYNHKVNDHLVEYVMATDPIAVDRRLRFL